jgi:hypothetical protein
MDGRVLVHVADFLLERKALHPKFANPKHMLNNLGVGTEGVTVRGIFQFSLGRSRARTPITLPFHSPIGTNLPASAFHSALPRSILGHDNRANHAIQSPVR